jgi:HAD superfamily hydrolase (TIGR01509 family)
MRAIRAVVFDMDGLLIDTEPIWRKVEIEVFGRLGLHLTEEQCMQTMGVRVAQVVELWHSRHPWSGPSIAEVTDEIVAGVIAHVRADGVPMPGVLAALTMVHDAGLPIAIASSSSEDMIRAVIQRLGIESYIKSICSADDEPEGKPHPAVYLRAAERLGVPPEACLALEDSPNGVLSAKAAGMYCIAVPDRYLAGDPRMNEADLRLDSLEDFTPDLLRRLVTDACSAGRSTAEPQLASPDS